MNMTENFWLQVSEPETRAWKQHTDLWPLQSSRLPSNKYAFSDLKIASVGSKIKQYFFWFFFFFKGEERYILPQAVVSGERCSLKESTWYQCRKFKD